MSRTRKTSGYNWRCDCPRCQDGRRHASAKQADEDAWVEAELLEYGYEDDSPDPDCPCVNCRLFFG